MQKKVNTAAPLAGPNFVSPDGAIAPGVKMLIPPELNARQERPYVVNADNRAAPPIMLVVVLVADLVIGVLTFLAFYYFGRLDGLMSFLLAIVGVVGIALLALFLLSGDVPALFEIQKSSRIERRRTDAIRDIALGWVQVAHVQAEAQRTDAQARLLEAKTSDKELALALAKQPAAQPFANQLETYVAAEPPADNLREEMKAWIADVVGDGASVDAEGKILVGVPWSTNGELSPSERARVLEWFRVANSSARGGWVIDLRRNAWRVNLEEYPDAAQVVGQLAAVPMPRRK